MTNIIEFQTVMAARAQTYRVDGEAVPVIDLSKPRRESRTSCLFQSTRPAGYTQTNGQLNAAEIWAALDEGRVLVHYQPQYDLKTGRTVSAEALVRLVDDDGQLIYPDRFIQRAEQGDLIVPLGRAVIRQACSDLAACRADGVDLERVAINLSAHQLNVDTGLPDYVDQELASCGLGYADFEFELTERQHLTSACEGLAVLTELSQRGARILIDDFGIGYSSVVYLTTLPLSGFKLDRELVKGLPENVAVQSVVRSLLTMARELGLEVVAEGIETDAQQDFLAQAGCPFGQGFGYARPADIASLRSFVEQQGQPLRRCIEAF